MTPLETRTNSKNEIEEGYFLTIEQLDKLVVDFAVDWHDGFVSNNKSYIEHWLKQGESNYE